MKKVLKYTCLKSMPLDLVGKCGLRFGKSTLDLLRLKKAAFTLAEVLIVLGIIGVIAAMTIPTLMNKIQKYEYVVALKKEYSTFSNGFSQILANEGVDKLEDTSL